MWTWQSNFHVVCLGFHMASNTHRLEATGYNKFYTGKFLKHLKGKKSEIMIKWEFYLSLGRENGKYRCNAKVLSFAVFSLSLMTMQCKMVGAAACHMVLSSYFLKLLDQEQFQVELKKHWFLNKICYPTLT